MSPVAEVSAWSSIVGLVVGAAALAISVWVLFRIGGLSKRLILDIRVPTLIEPLRKAATKLKDSKFDKNNLRGDSSGDVRRILASIHRIRDQLPNPLKVEVDRLKKLELEVFEGSNLSLEELYTQMIIVSDTLQEMVEERRVGARNG